MAKPSFYGVVSIKVNSQLSEENPQGGIFSPLVFHPWSGTGSDAIVEMSQNAMANIWNNWSSCNKTKQLKKKLEHEVAKNV